MAHEWELRWLRGCVLLLPLWLQCGDTSVTTLGVAKPPGGAGGLWLKGVVASPRGAGTHRGSSECPKIFHEGIFPICSVWGQLGAGWEVTLPGFSLFLHIFLLKRGLEGALGLFRLSSGIVTARESHFPHGF